MNNYIYVGKIINTFGIKGELKIVSDFEYKNKIFKKEFPIYIGELKTKELINTHRVHKNYDLIIFNGYTNINEVLKYKGQKIYIKREDLNLKENEYLLQDLIGFKVIDNLEEIGIIIDYEIISNNVLLKVNGKKTFYIPMYSTYINTIDLKNRQVITNEGRNLII